MSSGEHEHLRDLSQIQFLVLDEADRMTQEHSFPQLIKILDLVNDANPADENDDDDNEDESDDEDGRDRLIGLPGVPGEAHLTMLSDDILKKIEAQREEVDPEPNEFLDDELEDDGVDQQVEDLEEDIPEEWLDQRVHRQTFVFSATLTLPFTSTKPTTLSLKKRKKLGLQGGIAEILEKTRAMGETKVVDLSLTSSASSFGSRSNPAHQDRGIKLPPGLSVEQIKCTQRHKDSHLYAYLMTTSQGSSGPCLVFCNSIAAVRRVGATLQTLGFSVRILHAHMQQVGSIVIRHEYVSLSEGVDEKIPFGYNLKIQMAASRSQKDFYDAARCGFFLSEQSLSLYSNLNLTSDELALICSMDLFVSRFFRLI